MVHLPSGGIALSGQFSILIICKFWHKASSYGSLTRFWLSFMYKLSNFSNVPISSGKNCKLFSPIDKYVRAVKWPIVRGKAVNWFDCKINRCKSRSKPISLGRDSMRFSSKSRTRNFRKLPIVFGIFFSKLLDSVRISRFCSDCMSSGSLVSEFVPKFNSTICTQVPTLGLEIDFIFYLFRFSVIN